VADLAGVEALVRAHRPSHVFHLAANSTTRHDAVFENHATIATGTLNVLEAVRRHAPDARVFVTGSGLQFRNDGRPVSERDPFDAGSPYAASRIAAVYAARYYRTLGVRAYVGYLFHHDSPLRKPGHVSQLVATAARRIAAGGREPLELGDLTTRKEWAFAGDVARAILALVGQDEVWEAAIGTGEAYTIERWVEACFGLVGLDWRDHVRLKPGFGPSTRAWCRTRRPYGRLGWLGGRLDRLARNDGCRSGSCAAAARAARVRSAVLVRDARRTTGRPAGCSA
jgi:GDPmannose 4,6-dehydratase